jgi:hypothetical protein
MPGAPKVRICTVQRFGSCYDNNNNDNGGGSGGGSGEDNEDSGGDTPTTIN